MRTYKNEIHVMRGETWTMSKLIQNKDGSPYIVSSELKNPHWLITVSNSRYANEGRYILNKWLSIKDLPTFYDTVPVEVESFNTLPGGYDETKGNEALFVKDGDYRRYDPDTGEFVPYECRILTTFTNNITSEWIEQEYYYSISLVSGNSVKDYLTNLCNEFGIEANEDIEKMLKDISKISPDSVAAINTSRPIVIDTMYPILLPTKLYVESDM